MRISNKMNQRSLFLLSKLNSINYSHLHLALLCIVVSLFYFTPFDVNYYIQGLKGIIETERGYP